MYKKSSFEALRGVLLCFGVFICSKLASRSVISENLEAGVMGKEIFSGVSSGDDSKFKAGSQSILSGVLNLRELDSARAEKNRA